MAWVVILTMTITLLVFGVFLLLSANINQAIAGLKGRTTIVAYLKDNLQREKIQQIRSIISKMVGVIKVEYTSKDEALSQFKKELGPQSFILEALDTNPLPASLEIKADINLKEAEINRLALKIEGVDGITAVDYAPKLVKVLSNISFLLKVILLSVGIVFTVATLIIIFNTIKLVLFSRSREIEIMRLVGATDSFILWPYLLEGIIQGAIAGCIATITLWSIYQLIIYKINTMGFTPFGFSFLSLQETLIIIALGVFFGFFGSLVSLRYFLVRRQGIVDEEE